VQQEQKKVLKPVQRPQIVKDMEMRAKQRQDRRAEMKREQQEKERIRLEERRREEAAKEEERKKKAEEEKQAKRAVKEEEAKKKEEEKRELEREKKRLDEAREYYKRGLMIKYGLVPLGKNVERAREAEYQADGQYIKWIKLNGLIYIRLAV
jgi:hypothetical protein